MIIRHVYKIMEAFTLFSTDYTKHRVGKEFDGGYVLCDISGEYDIFISGGIDYDYSFEVDIIKKYPNLVCHSFDGTIPQLYNVNKNFLHIKKNLGSQNNEYESNLSEYFDKYNNILMKMDIEGGEIPLFDSFDTNKLNKIKQLVIEFHTCMDFRIPSKIAETHYLVHFHCNNAGGTSSIYGKEFPNIFECTYIRKTDCSVTGLNKKTLPTEVDQPNVEVFPDIFINYPPLVNI